MKIKSKILFLFYFLTISTVIFGQKKLEYGVHIGVFSGTNAEFYNRGTFSSVDGSSSSYLLSSSIDEDPSILAGINIASSFNAKGWQFKTGLDVHSFEYTLSTFSNFGGKVSANSTATRNTVVQLPMGYSKRWGNFVVYTGTGLTFFNIQDLSTEKEKASFEPIHLFFINSTFDNFKKIYPFYEVSLGWRWKRSSIEIGYRTSGKLEKRDFSFGFDQYSGSRSILYLGTTLLF
ncbi:MAG: hypothetical protein RLZZ292_1355 [Bacteroidota bacterium]|jgi:hypothetical protein